MSALFHFGVALLTGIGAVGCVDCIVQMKTRVASLRGFFESRDQRLAGLACLAFSGCTGQLALECLAQLRDVFA